MVCVVNVKSNEADGQDSSVHSFFYLLVYDIVTNSLYVVKIVHC